MLCGPVRGELMRAGPDRGGPVRIGPLRAGPDRGGPERVGPERVELLRADPDRGGPVRDGPPRVGPERVGPERVELLRADPDRGWPVRDEPVRWDPRRVEDCLLPPGLAMGRAPYPTSAAQAPYPNIICSSSGSFPCHSPWHLPQNECSHLARGGVEALKVATAPRSWLRAP